jgi:hypothetical protein
VCVCERERERESGNEGGASPGGEAPGSAGLVLGGPSHPPGWPPRPGWRGSPAPAGAGRRPTFKFCAAAAPPLWGSSWPRRCEARTRDSRLAGSPKLQRRRNRRLAPRPRLGSAYLTVLTLCTAKPTPSEAHRLLLLQHGFGSTSSRFPHPAPGAFTDWSGVARRCSWTEPDRTGRARRHLSWTGSPFPMAYARTRRAEARTGAPRRGVEALICA